MRRLQVVAGAMVVGAWIVGLNIATVAQSRRIRGRGLEDNHQVKSMIATLQTDARMTRSTRRDRSPPCCVADRG